MKVRTIETPIKALPPRELWHKAVMVSRFEDLRLTSRRPVERPVVERPVDGKVTDSLRGYELRPELLPSDRRMDGLRALYMKHEQERKERRQARERERQQKAKAMRRVKIKVTQED